MSIEVTSALIGGSSAIIVEFIRWIWEKHNQSSTKKYEIKNNYLSPLLIAIYDCYRRIPDLFDPSINKSQRIYSTVDISSKDIEWFYNDGYFLLSSTYLLSSVIARLHYVKENLPILSLNKKEYKSIIDGIRTIEVKFRDIGGIWQIIQYDIAYDMMLDDKTTVSYHDFCLKLKDTSLVAIYYQLIQPIANASSYRDEFEQLKTELGDLHNTISVSLQIDNSDINRPRATPVD